MTFCGDFWCDAANRSACIASRLRALPALRFGSSICPSFHHHYRGAHEHALRCHPQASRCLCLASIAYTFSARLEGPTAASASHSTKRGVWRSSAKLRHGRMRSSTLSLRAQLNTATWRVACPFASLNTTTTHRSYPFFGLLYLIIPLCFLVCPRPRNLATSLNARAPYYTAGLPHSIRRVRRSHALVALGAWAVSRPHFRTLHHFALAFTL